jgi:hypothetical protein
MNDWLDDITEPAVAPAPDDQRAQQIAAQHRKAQLYRVFEDDPRGRELLKHWEMVVLRRRLPPSSSLQEFAYDAAQKGFVQFIQEQLEFAKSNAELA